MIQPGVYRHYKGPLYRVLFTATWAHSIEWIVPDQELLTFVKGQTIFVQRLPETRPGGFFGGTPLFTVKWSGNDGHLRTAERLVTYVSLSEQGRVSARTVGEFEEMVDNKAGTLSVVCQVPRFERIGP